MADTLGHSCLGLTTEIATSQIISFPGSLAAVEGHIAMMWHYRHKKSAGRFRKIVSLLMR